MKRPAETGGVAAAVGGIIARIVGVTNPDTLAYIIAAVGFIPALITFVVANGGLRGVAGIFWHGRKSQKGYAGNAVIFALLIIVIAVLLGVWVHPWFFLLLLLLVLVLL